MSTRTVAANRALVGIFDANESPRNAKSHRLSSGYEGEELQISIVGHDSSLISTKEILLTADTLYFSFSEPEEQVELDCALAKNKAAEFSGKCVDPSGKWAKFTMTPPTN